MLYFAIAIVGLVAGAFCMYVALETKRKQVEMQRLQVETQEMQVNQARVAINEREGKLAIDLKRRQMELEDRLARARAEVKEKEESAMRRMQERAAALDQLKLQLLTDKNELGLRVVAYTDLENENTHLKKDMFNLTIGMRKCQLDGQKLMETQKEISQRVRELGARYLKDHVKWIGNSLNANNYASCKQRLTDVIERCRSIGFKIGDDEATGYIADLRAEYEREVRASLQREEQARIKAQIREEQLREREIQRELDRIEHERSVLAAALEKALAATQDHHSAEVESLRARLEEAESKQRAISQAQLTKAGFLYVISNIGSFGEGVFKVGMTRRLIPMDRVKELGDASVPFPFDVHMMISCDDAPALENAIHRRLLQCQVNKTNPRKEFFRTDVETIAAIVREHRGDIDYVVDAEALQYRQSLTMSTDDQEFIEHVFDEAENEEGFVAEEPSFPIESN